LPEWLGQVLYGFRLNANPAILDLAAQDDLPWTLRGKAEASADIALVSELDGIADEVREHLAQPARIPVQHVRDSPIHDYNELDALASRGCEQQINDILDDARTSNWMFWNST